MGRPLGQHFLTRSETAAWVADAAHLLSTDTVLEIGPGKGILTRELLARAGKVIAVEKDPRLIAELTTTFRDELYTGKLVLVEEDIRDFDPATSDSLLVTRYSLVANIPYYITGRIIRQFLTSDHQPSTMVLLVQKEVAERVVARKTKPFDSSQGKESLLSMSIKAYGTPEYVRTVKAGAFSPPPKVDSAILAVRDISHRNFTEKSTETRFFELLHAGFANKRKQLAGNVGARVSPATFVTCGVLPGARAETLTLAEWLCLTRNDHTQGR